MLRENRRVPRAERLERLLDVSVWLSRADRHSSRSLCWHRTQGDKLKQARQSAASNGNEAVIRPIAETNRAAIFATQLTRTRSAGTPDLKPS